MDNKVLLLHKSKNKALILAISIGMVLFSILMISESFAAVPATGSIVLHQTPRKEIVNEDGVYKEIDVYLNHPLYGVGFYKIFDASISQDSSGNTTGVSYTYKGSAEKIQLINEGGFFTVDGRGYVTVNDSAKDEHNASSLSEAAVNWLKENADKIGTSTGTLNSQSVSQDYIHRYRFTMDGLTCYRIENDNEHTVSWVDIPLGYYFVSSNVGTAVEVTSAVPTVDIYDKNSGPQLEKKITKLTDADSMDHSTDIEAENGHGTGASEVRADHVGTVQIGDTVEYEVHITAEPGAENYLFYDYMHDGLTLDPDTVRIYLGENELASENHYELIASDKTMELQMIMNNTLRLRYGDEDGHQVIKEYTGIYPRWDPLNSYKCHIVALFDKTFLDTIKEEQDIYIRYRCTVNSKAVIAYDDIGNENIQSANGTYNDVILFFGHNNYASGSHITDRDRLYSARIVVYKYEGGSSSSSSSSSAGGGRPLNGVRFILKRKDGKYLQQDPVTFVNKWVENQADATGFVSGAAYDNRGNYRNTYTPHGGNGFLIIDGLTNGEYTLIETDPLPGYNSAEPIEITINNQHNTRKELQKQVNVANKIGSILPSTGGTGLIGIYAAGVFLTMVSLTGLIKRRRGAA